MHLPRALQDVDLAQLNRLHDEQIGEDKFIEYKSGLKPRAASDRVPFLATISSFANTAGGDVLLGVEAQAGVPKNFPGFDDHDIDGLKLQIEQTAATGLEPRLPRIEIRPVRVGGGRSVLVIRVPRSWFAPHRVKDNQKFYGRHSGGKYELDVDQLRTAFTLSESISERVRRFRVDRLMKIQAGEAPVALAPGGRLILHVVPLTAFVEPASMDMSSYFASPLDTIDDGFTDRTFNLDGVAAWVRTSSGVSSYTQFFRNGAVEAANVLSSADDKRPSLTPMDEQLVRSWFQRCRKKLSSLGIEPPLFVFYSLIGARGCRFETGSGFPRKLREITEDVVMIPEVSDEDFAVEAHTVLRPIFDTISNAFGLPGSINYGENGEWLVRG